MSKPLSSGSVEQANTHTLTQQPNSPENRTTSLQQESLKPLGKRLAHLFGWANRREGLAKPYDDIWDICCDHGLLGLHLHEVNPHSHVHLVDCVPGIIEALISRYPSRFNQQISAECMDAATIKVAPSADSLLVIAGVSGSTMVEIISGILATRQVQNSSANIDFLLSPNGNVIELRAFLGTHAFALIDEQLVCEKERAHEHMLLRFCGNKYDNKLKELDGKKSAEKNAEPHAPFNPCSAIGDVIWRQLNPEKRAYIQGRIRYHQSRCSHKHDAGAQQLVDLYSALLK